MSAGGGEAGHRARLGDAGRAGAVTDNDAALLDLVIAARGGDRRAAEALISAHLPMLYRIVGRALDGHADVDDVVQETVLRAHRDLSALRTPASFRSWLVAIAMRQISSRLRAWQHDRERMASLDDAAQLPDPDAEFADVTLLRLGLSAQRRHVATAARWLDPDDQDLAVLWWQELTGELSRAEVVAALGIGSAHARVRLQRMRNQLELSRHLVAALEAEPMCPELEALTEGWTGMPEPRWRKRFARHLRVCERCGAVGAGLVSVERLVLGGSLVLLPVAGGAVASGALGGSAGSGATTAGATTAGATTAGATTAGATTVGVGKAVGAGWLTQLAGLKVAAAVLVGAAVSGGFYLIGPDIVPGEARGLPPVAPTVQDTPRFRTSAPPEPSAGPALVPDGPVTIRQAGAVIALDGDALVVSPGERGVAVTAVPGIADANCLSLRAADGRYVRHASFRLVLATGAGEDQRLFRRDATFCAQAGPRPGTVRFTSANYPERFLRVADGRLRLDSRASGNGFAEDSTFTLTGA